MLKFSFKNSLLKMPQEYTKICTLHPSIHPSTDFPPNVFLFGKVLSLIFYIFNPSIQLKQLDKGQYIEFLLSDFNKNYVKYYEDLSEVQQKQNLTKN